MRRARRLQFNSALERLVIEPVQHLLVFLGRDHLLSGDVHAAADGNQQERVQGVGAQAARQVEHQRQLARVVARDRHVDLERHAAIFQMSEAA